MPKALHVVCHFLLAGVLTGMPKGVGAEGVGQVLLWGEVAGIIMGVKITSCIP